MSPNILITEVDRRRLGALITESFQLDSLERRYLSELEHELAGAQTIDSSEVPPDVVTMNSTVELSDLDTGETTNYTLVYPREADVLNNRISVLAPAGTAILGYRVGDVVRYPAPKGMVRLRIDNLLYQPERVGDFGR